MLLPNNQKINLFIFKIIYLFRYHLIPRMYYDDITSIARESKTVDTLQGSKLEKLLSLHILLKY